MTLTAKSTMNPEALLKHLFNAALGAVSAEASLRARLPPPESLPPHGKLIVIGAGKAAGAMAACVNAHYGERITGGCVVTRYEHGVDAGRIRVIEAAHPVPDKAGQDAAREILACVQGLSADDTVIALLSGGASALLALPACGLTLADKQGINRALLRSGATIHEMNCVRKHLSAIKGGRLAQACLPARVFTYVISDVPGDDPGTVGSGPTLENETTREQALDILRRYQIEVPAHVMSHLQSTDCTTPMFTDELRNRMQVEVVATARAALDAAARAVRAIGLPVWILSDAIEGEARDIGRMHAAIALEIQRDEGPIKAPCVLLSGGETTVTVKGQGRGGRNAEFLLGLFQVIQQSGCTGLSALACDTDGIDGVEDNSGAWFGAAQLAKATDLQLRPSAYLDNNDAYAFFHSLDSLIVTGPTRTNVNDFRAIFIEPRGL
jgi:hydroxypyruvate reductase